jgi:hypothetical protein
VVVIGVIVLVLVALVKVGMVPGICREVNHHLTCSQQAQVEMVQQIKFLSLVLLVRGKKNDVSISNRIDLIHFCFCKKKDI